MYRGNDPSPSPADLGVLDKLSIFGAFTMQYVHICGVFGNI